MNQTLYLVAAAILIPVAWFLLRAAIGNLISMETAGYAYLQQKLKKEGLLQYVPAECVRECTAISIIWIKKIAQLEKSGVSERSRLVDDLDHYGFMLREWIRSNDPFDKPEFQEAKRIFEKYAIPRLEQRK